jgi:hypothetical protein
MTQQMSGSTFEALQQLKLSMASIGNLPRLTWRMYRVSLFTFDLAREREYAARFGQFNQAQSNVLLGENVTETITYVLTEEHSDALSEWLALATVSEVGGKRYCLPTSTRDFLCR